MRIERWQYARTIVLPLEFFFVSLLLLLFLVKWIVTIGSYTVVSVNLICGVPNGGVYSFRIMKNSKVKLLDEPV